MNRKEFIKLATGTAALPLFNIGCAGFGQGRARQVAAGSPIRVALIGCGLRGRDLMQAILKEKIVALVDPDPACRAKARERAAKLPNAANFAIEREFADYHALFDEMGDSLDAVVIATSNRHHALAALLAMRRGIHVYVEKPMAFTVEEAQLMGRVAKETGVVTQVGNFGHSTRAMKVCVEAIKAGVIGDVSDVWCYDDRVNAMVEHPESAPPPNGMDWNAWCGPAEHFDYYPGAGRRFGVHPHDWHSWIALGNGSIGNMGAHIMDAPFWALDLGATPPASVQATRADFGCPGSWTIRTAIEWKFPACGNRGPVSLHWYDGLADGVDYKAADLNNTGFPRAGRKMQFIPEAVLKCERDFHLEKAPFLSNGALFVGTKGYAWFGHHSMVRFLPKTLGTNIDKFVGYKSLEHMHEFFGAIRERRPANTNFDFSVPIGTAICLANIASRRAKKALCWDGRRFINDDAANSLLRATYRTGWELDA